MNKERANAHALQYAFNEGVSVMISTGETLNLGGVPLKAVFKIGESKETFRFRLQQYIAFRAASTNPELKVWEHENRMPAWNNRWIRALEMYCGLVLLESTLKNRTGWFVRWHKWRARRKVKRLQKQLTVQDMENIVKAYNEHHNINAIVDAVFDAELDAPEDEAQEEAEEDKKKVPPNSTSESATPASKSSESP